MIADLSAVFSSNQHDRAYRLNQSYSISEHAQLLSACAFLVLENYTSRHPQEGFFFSNLFCLPTKRLQTRDKFLFHSSVKPLRKTNLSAE